MSAREELGAPRIRYFIGEGAEAEAVKVEGLALHQSYCSAVKAFVTEMSCATVTESSRSGIVGLAFLEKLSDPVVARQGLRFDSRQPSDKEGMDFQVYVADRRSKVGREIVERIKAIGGFNFSAWAVDRLQAKRHVSGASPKSRTGMALYVSVAGVVKGQLVLSVPEEPGAPYETPAGFREIKKSEWIAFTEE